MTNTHPTRHLPAGALLVNRVHRNVSPSWIKVLLLLAAAILAIALLGLLNVAATAVDPSPSFGGNEKLSTKVNAAAPGQPFGPTIQLDQKFSSTPQAIAFVSSRDGNSEIYLMNPDGSNQSRLTDNNADDYQPSLSPDGSRIAFMSTRDENEEVYVMNADGSGQTRLTNGIYSDREPSFSNDGKKIVFSTFRDGNQEIYVMNADGTAPTRLTVSPAIDDTPVFSPDDSKIAFSSLSSNGYGNWDIYIMNADGTNVTRLTDVAPYADLQPSFSPDGKKIAFSSNRNGSPDVYVMNVDGTNQTRLTTQPDFDDSPTFSPDGVQIAYRSFRDLNADIFVMNSDGTGAAQLTTSSAMDSTPSWGGPSLNAFQFAAANYSVAEDCAEVTITVKRSGDLTHSATVDFATSDQNASQRTDYNIGEGTLTFSAGETTKTFTLLANEDHYLEGNESFDISLIHPSLGTGVGIQREAVVTIMDGDAGPPTANPNDDAALFVCQHYHDFMSRQPDADGAAYWTTRITDCGVDEVCIHNRRLDVSNAFFREPEFQETGTYVYRLHKMAFGVRPSYGQFMADRSRVVGGAQLEQSKTDFAEAFAQRPEFTAKFPTSLAPYAFVEGLNANTANLLTAVECDALANGLQNGTETRGTVLKKMADNQKFIDGEYNTSFVLTQYFGYLRRDPDQGGFNFWLGQVNQYPIRDVGIQHAMVCSFITSREYQERFSSVVLHSNADCAQ